MIVYEGLPERTEEGGFLVLQNGMELSPKLSQTIINHSPNGFSWGYGGSGPAQLALALLLEEVGARRARVLYQQFKWEVIARLPQDQPWQLTSDQILDWVNTQGSP